MLLSWLGECGSEWFTVARCAFGVCVVHGVLRGMRMCLGVCPRGAFMYVFCVGVFRSVVCVCVLCSVWLERFLCNAYKV